MNSIEKIKNKVLNEERLVKEDGLFLLQLNDLLSMGRLANAEKQKRTRDKVFFNINCHVNITNLCVARCSFCAFSRDKGENGAYEMSREDVVNKIRGSLNTGITEVHIVSGLHPDKPFDFYIGVLREISNEFPSIHIKAFTPVEIKYFSDISELSIKDVLVKLKDAGLGSMPGGGAEVLSNRVRQELCPNKATVDDWLEIMETAHLLGLKTNATLLYGHIETDEEIIDHLLSLRDLQDRTSGFQTFIPLLFHPDNTGVERVNKSTAFEQLRMFALSRLMLDNFEHIKAYWVMTGLRIAQLAIHFGADDIDGTVVDEKITHAAGANTAEGLTVEKLINLIKVAGKTPVQRDTLYNIIKTY